MQRTKKSQQNAGDKLKEQGNQQLKQGNYSKALEFFTRAIEQDSSNFAYFHNRSLAYFLLDNMRESLNDAIISRKLNPKHVSSFFREASGLYETDQLPIALDVIEQGLAISPSHEELLSLKQKVVHELSARIAETEGVTEEAKQSLSSIIQFVESHSGDASRIRLVVTPATKERRVVAKEMIQEKSLIMAIPTSTVITLDIALQSAAELLSDLSCTLTSLELSSLKHVSFALFILSERKKKNASRFEAFLSSLPTEFSIFPLKYSDIQLGYLAGTIALKKVIEQKQNIASDFAKLQQHSKAFIDASITLPQFEDAILCSTSRVFSIQTSQGKSSAMVPLVDMLNHSQSGFENAQWSMNEVTNSFEVFALKKILRGQEICVTYGSKCNSKFLLNYGFAQRTSPLNEQEQPMQIKGIKSHELKKYKYSGINQFNEISVLYDFDTAEQDPTLNLKAQLINMKTVPKACQSNILEDFEEANSSGFLGYLRFICIRDPIQLSKLDQAHKKFIEQTNQPTQSFLPQKTPPLSLENEILMWSKVQELLIPQLLAHQTSVKHDQELLAAHDQNKERILSKVELACVLVRLGEKKVLEYYLDMANKMMNLLETKSKKEILDSAREDAVLAPYFHYIIQVILARIMYQK